MKSKFLKIALPLFTFMFAILLSSFTVNDEAPIAYYDDGVSVKSTTEVDCVGDEEDCTIIVNTIEYQLFSHPSLLPQFKLERNIPQ